MPDRIRTEEEWLQWIKSKASNFDSAWIEQSIGDDAAVIKTNDSERLLVSTDSLIENVHFLRSQNPFEVGYKALAVNLSDISAMGGRARAFTLNLSFPSDLESKWIEGFFQGLFSLAEKYKITLIGGDLTRSKEIMISINIFGCLSPQRIKLRSGAQSGDLIFVTGYLGDSAGLRNYLRPPIRVCEAEFLSARSEVHSLMDLSDGLLKDLPRLAQASGVGFEVDLDKIPLSPDLRQKALDQQKDPLEWAVAGGEDYELLGTVDALKAPALVEEFQTQFSLPLTVVGRMCASGQHWLKGNKSIQIPWKSFEHF